MEDKNPPNDKKPLLPPPAGGGPAPGGGGNGGESQLHKMKLEDLYAEFETSKWGLTTEEAKKAREKHGLNSVPPPLSAPAWLCCLLPCLLQTKAMQQYHDCVPEYALVMRNKKWMKMDAASVVPGDVIRVEAGERIAADMRVIESMGCTMETSYVHEGVNPLSCDPYTSGTTFLESPNMAFLGYLVIAGTCTGVVVATGASTVVGKLIGQQCFPPGNKS
jgi:hypothetical protein